MNKLWNYILWLLGLRKRYKVIKLPSLLEAYSQARKGKGDIIIVSNDPLDPKTINYYLK